MKSLMSASFWFIYFCGVCSGQTIVGTRLDTKLENPKGEGLRTTVHETQLGVEGLDPLPTPADIENIDPGVFKYPDYFGFLSPYFFYDDRTDYRLIIVNQDLTKVLDVGESGWSVSRGSVTDESLYLHGPNYALQYLPRPFTQNTSNAIPLGSSKDWAGVPGFGLISQHFSMSRFFEESTQKIYNICSGSWVYEGPTEWAGKFLIKNADNGFFYVFNPETKICWSYKGDFFKSSTPFDASESYPLVSLYSGFYRITDQAGGTLRKIPGIGIDGGARAMKLIAEPNNQYVVFRPLSSRRADGSENQEVLGVIVGERFVPYPTKAAWNYRPYLRDHNGHLFVQESYFDASRLRILDFFKGQWRVLLDQTFPGPATPIPEICFSNIPDDPDHFCLRILGNDYTFDRKSGRLIRFNEDPKVQISIHSRFSDQWYLGRIFNFNESTSETKVGVYLISTTFHAHKLLYEYGPNEGESLESIASLGKKKFLVKTAINTLAPGRDRFYLYEEGKLMSRIEAEIPEYYAYFPSSDPRANRKFEMPIECPDSIRYLRFYEPGKWNFLVSVFDLTGKYLRSERKFSDDDNLKLDRGASSKRILWFTGTSQWRSGPAKKLDVCGV